MNLKLEDVPSPEDFPPPSTAPGLRELDEALRCNICKELYSAPVTIGCGHCFCSLCIRQELPQRSKQECPLCRVSTNESHIRKNTKLEEAVKAWNLARPYVLEILREDERRRSRREPRSLTPPPMMNGFKNKTGRVRPKKRKRSPETEDEDIVEITASQLETNYLADKGKRPIRNSSQPPRSSGSQSPGETTCPICTHAVPISTINQHLDSGCKLHLSSDNVSKQKQKDGWGKVFGGAPTSAGAGPSKGKSRTKGGKPIDDAAEPLPKVSYDTLKPKRLREMLQEHELTPTGEKDILVARHQRWVIIYNANLDASQRKSLDQLRKDLASWEKARHSKTIIPDDKAHERRNKDQYADLIAKARATAPAARVSREQPRDSPITVDRDIAEGGSGDGLGDSPRSSETVDDVSNAGAEDHEILVVDP